MVTDVERLRVIYELDDKPAMRAFERVRAAANKANAEVARGSREAEAAVKTFGREGAALKDKFDPAYAMIDYVLILSSILAVAGTLMLAYGYRASLCSRDPATRAFAWSMALLATSVGLRRLTWDLVHPIVNGAVDQRPLNIVFNVIAVAAAYTGLRARWLLIPEAERARWHWWSAWMHPSLLRLRADRPAAPDDRA